MYGSDENYTRVTGGGRPFRTWSMPPTVIWLRDYFLVQMLVSSSYPRALRSAQDVPGCSSEGDVIVDGG